MAHTSLKNHVSLPKSTLTLEPKFHWIFFGYVRQGSKIALARSYLRVPQAAGQVENLIILVKLIFSHVCQYLFCDAGQVPILRYFETWVSLMLHNNVNFLWGLTYLMLCHIYCSIRQSQRQKSPKGGQVLWSITFILEAFMSPYHAQYRIRKCTSSCEGKQQFK